MFMKCLSMMLNTYIRIDLTYSFGEKLTFSTEWVKKECKTTKYLFKCLILNYGKQNNKYLAIFPFSSFPNDKIFFITVYCNKGNG